MQSHQKNAPHTGRIDPGIFPMKLRALASLLPRRGSLPRCSSFAFTLVELLVVVAIIGILAALLTPTINTAMQKANQARCVGNLRNIGAAAGAWSANNNNQVLFQQAGDAINVPDFAGNWFDRILDFAPNGSTSLFHCPSDKKYGISGEKSYACSGTFYIESERRPVVYPSVLAPSKKILVIDVEVGGGCIIRDVEFYSTEFGGKISFRHFGRANALFTDGHVETLPAVKDAPPPAVALPWKRDDTLAKKWISPSVPGN